MNSKGSGAVTPASRAPDDDGVLRQHYMAPEGSTATTQTRERAPRSLPELVVAPRFRCWYPVRFTKRITGLCFAEEGLLVKDITKFLTLSLPDGKQSMTNLAAAPAPGPVSCVPSAPGPGSGSGPVCALDCRNTALSRHF